MTKKEISERLKKAKEILDERPRIDDFLRGKEGFFKEIQEWLLQFFEAITQVESLGLQRDHFREIGTSRIELLDSLIINVIFLQRQDHVQEKRSEDIMPLLEVFIDHKPFSEAELTSMLRNAVDFNSVAAVQAAIKCGAKPGLQSEELPNMFHRALASGALEIFKALKESETPDNFLIQLQTPDKRGNYLLHLAVILGEVSLVRELVELGAPLEVKNGKDQTPIEMNRVLAAKGDHSEMTHYLEGALVASIEKKELTAVMDQPSSQAIGSKFTKGQLRRTTPRSL